MPLLAKSVISSATGSKPGLFHACILILASNTSNIPRLFEAWSSPTLASSITGLKR